MTNTKFRKRALLSSVAMLLVALVALGSATFAWFTNDPSARADGLHMKAAASTGLVIITDSAITNAGADKDNDGDWVHHDFLNSNAGRTATQTFAASPVELVAASCNMDTGNDAVKFYNVVAADDDNYAADTTKPVQLAENAGIYHEKIWMKVTGTSTAQPVKITALTITPKSGATTKAAALAPSVRVAVVFNNGTNSKLINEYARAAGSSQHITAVADPGTTTYAAATKASKNFLAASAIADTALGTVKTDGSCYCEVYVYLDGETTPVKNTNIDLTEVISSVDIRFAIAS